MKKLEKYESPCVEVIDVEVEKGFATSAGVTLEDYQDGGNAWGN